MRYEVWLTSQSSLSLQKAFCFVFVAKYRSLPYPSSIYFTSKCAARTKREAKCSAQIQLHFFEITCQYISHKFAYYAQQFVSYVGDAFDMTLKLLLHNGSRQLPLRQRRRRFPRDLINILVSCRNTTMTSSCREIQMYMSHVPTTAILPTGILFCRSAQRFQ
jgi:hypothetical protein